ncbi:hypothetical protein LTR91_009089 [Friedmanniomyces endolithicus]|uniref:Uncharacterized protein n=1 Tax=Friedmanniomyces endolithicus TaxID=329885 RepID=A0A4V5NBW9_9PEZI|nr:hypothetical protein LTS09_007079 [Friedmanniomyces endolithicus]KAK0286379.1 hypothetical protein LTR35_004814 [Friedmanniomyces endolithicus]KAK0299280.1 hypothetical protein LTS00_002391 [Friedmanniomyces endolithicus]KAK0304745.1 hypothetical protein LTR01_007244 [Friedmanniomyces endolithicus]KAK0310850.1 hypothetical protein LTR82_014597 [Friedmanniomyces endolithicus]
MATADGDEHNGKEKQEQAPFRLLDLPAELQLRIFEFAVCSDEPIEITRQDTGMGLSDSESSQGDPESDEDDTASSQGDTENDGTEDNNGTEDDDTEDKEQDDGSVCLEPGTIESPVFSRMNLTQPALTRTCRTIRMDALKLYYSRNRFRASYCRDSDPVDGRQDFDVLADWLQCIGAENRNSMGKLELFDSKSLEFVQRRDEEARSLEQTGSLCLWRAIGQLEQLLSMVQVEPGVHMASFVNSSFGG